MNKRQRKKARNKTLQTLIEAKTIAAKKVFDAEFENDKRILEKLINEKEGAILPPYYLEAGTGGIVIKGKIEYGKIHCKRVTFPK